MNLDKRTNSTAEQGLSRFPKEIKKEGHTYHRLQSYKGWVIYGKYAKDSVLGWVVLGPQKVKYEFKMRDFKLAVETFDTESGLVD